MNCPSCSHENPDGQKFCGECGIPLSPSGSRPVAEERKVVTALFCDLVGFTAISEYADPEDVDRMLAHYFAMARNQIESHGGTVEKFIGDAVVGVFGVPAAHEDDPERAVRAGLRIVEDAEELEAIGGEPLRLRIGINTGEALVRLGVAATSGEGFLSGDSINTASRIQSVAPEMGVAVGVATYEATSAVFDYEELEPATLKGKSEPVRVFHAKSSLSRYGHHATRTHRTPFIGREIDLAILKGVFDKTLAASTPQLVTIVGEPGLGKSRLVAELFEYVDTGRSEMVTWRQGRCLPYGEGITFWALGEIVKAHAGILESDDPATANAKLEPVLPGGAEREWFRQRLLPLLGIEASSTAERPELFAAWRRFFEHVAEESPTVLVFEDLHWADPPLLEFLAHLADRSEAVPLLVVGTARPELFERFPDHARSLRNNTPVNLAPLSMDETARLVAELLETSVIPAELQTPILERSGGNPLYAEEFVQLLRDRDLLVREGSAWKLTKDAEVPFPDSIQALIAARLNTLPPDRKALLADAGVIGKVFWVGAVAAMGDRSGEEVTEALRELSRKELVRPIRRSSLEGETEYTFLHVLARDVAYAQLPRASKASRHVAAAAWIESKAPGRLDDLADVLAYHYTSALELAKASGQTEQARDLEAPALRFLTLAGDRALGLDTGAALDAFERALLLTPEGHPQRPATLARFGEAAMQAFRLSEATAALEEATVTLRAQGEGLAAARAMRSLRGVLMLLNDPRHVAAGTEALALLEPLPPGRELLDALADVAADATFSGRPEEALELADRALAIADDAALPRPARALAHRGSARCSSGDAGGLQDYREALALATLAGQGHTAALVYGNLAIDQMIFEGPRASLETIKDGRGFTEGRGLKEMALWLETNGLTMLLWAGELEEGLKEAAALDQHADAAGDDFDLVEIRSMQAMALTFRGAAQETHGLLGWLATTARRSGRTDTAISGLAPAAIAHAALGQVADAKGLLDEIEAMAGLEGTPTLALYMPAMVRAAISIGDLDVAEQLAARLPPRVPYSEHALIAVRAALAEARGETEIAADAYAVAAARWSSLGVVPEQGFSLLGHGRCSVELARTSESAEVLRQARAIFLSCGMRPALEETDALLASATALSS